MSTEKPSTKAVEPTRKSILELPNEDARRFFLKPESYCSLDLPPYIAFGNLLIDVDRIINGKHLRDLRNCTPREYDDINYSILNNKDGKYAWRPFQLIHPVLYVSLVHQITEEQNWKLICEKFKEFSGNKKIRCLSLPVVSLTDEKDKAEQVSHWWQAIEQKSIELSLDYEYLLETDITDCYGSIYTHSIVWALHTKPEAKKKENRNNNNLIGSVIDNRIQDMRHGQTNGIPQGSALMDFIAEMVLGYIDLELTKKLQGENIDDYCILRYRDDYRIFVSNMQAGEKILKLLTETTIDPGLKLNSSKTKASNDVVQASIKSDKLGWMASKQSDNTLQKRLLLIHNHAKQFPNSGSLDVALDKYLKRIFKLDSLTEQPLPLIGIIVDIAYRNPRTYSKCASILSKLLSFVATLEEKRTIIEKIRQRFSLIPNTGHMQIWLQRVTLKFSNEINFDEPICKLVAGENARIWNNDWISSKKLKDAVDARKIVDKEKLVKITPVISPQEVELFIY
ncbi:MAG: RNA-directed DNA polymerase [Gallionella sp.]